MNTIIAIIKKDLRRVLPLLIGLWLAVAVELGLGFAAFLDVGLTFPTIASGLAWPKGIVAALTFLITAMVVQEDPVVGTRAFWQTRPIGTWRLLTAKLSVLLLGLIAVPILLHGPWWWYFDLTLTQVGGVVVGVALLQLVVVLPAAAMAALTDTFSRVLIWSLAVAAALGAGALFWSGFVVGVSGGAVWSFAVLQLALVVFAAVAAIVLVLQYTFRRTALSVAVLVLGLAGSGFAGRLAEEAIQASTEGGNSRVWRLETENVRDPQVKVRSASAYGLPDRTTRVRLDVEVDVPPHYLDIYQCELVSARSLLVWPDASETKLRMQFGRRVSQAPLRHALGMPEPVADPETQRWFTARASRPPPQRRATALTLSGRGAGFLPRIPAAPRLELTAQLRILRPLVLGEIGLHQGACLRRAGSAFLVESVSTERRVTRRTSLPHESLDVTMRVARVMSAAELLLGQQTWRADAPVYVFLNRQMNEVVRADRIWPASGVWVGGMIITPSTSPAPSTMTVWRRGDAWVLADPQYAEHLTLAVVGWDEVARAPVKASVEALQRKR
ncbi:hypothetical protein [Opitutus sp. ER46]|uniref:hypothetical protein n=1 Tax=Opitutus sp. ER46 TaxID=2161864 RepID=UPI000D309C60|nr:hypothetical protein [Opitutus sp. ER46]PTY00342.1 hypothetical protein DB354_01660 [Opitutus sp. ER46]